jgi:hypothetical protein
MRCGDCVPPVHSQWRQRWKRRGRKSTGVMTATPLGRLPVSPATPVSGRY